MTTKRRIVVEIVELGWDQKEVDYDVQGEEYGGPYYAGGRSGARDAAVQSAICGLHFEPIEGEKTYVGWSRCTINISGPMCIGDECPNGDPFLDPDDKEDMATQLCWRCRDSDDEGGE